jgi:hypothetical protein
MRYLLPKWPRAPIVMALSIPAVNRFDLADHGVAVTREVPTGLFSIGLPDIDWSDCGTLLTGALALAFVGYFESLAAARSMAVKHGYNIDPNQELITQGMSCGTAGLVGGFSVDGSLSKTSVADSAGQEGVRRHPVGRPIRGRSWTPREPDGAQSPLEHDVARAHGCSSLGATATPQSPLIAWPSSWTRTKAAQASQSSPRPSVPPWWS